MDGKRPLHIMHVIANLNSGGVQRLLVESLAAFDQEKCRHFVCCVTAGGVYEERLQALNIPYWIMERRCRFDPTILWQMARLMRQQQIDVVHGLNFTGNLWGRLAAKLARVPRIIAHERGTGWTENKLMRFVDRRLAVMTDVWLANSQAARQILIQHVGVPPGKIQVIYNGVPQPAVENAPSLRHKLGLSAALPLVGTIGRLDTPKGHQFLLRAIPLVWQTLPDVHFVIIGDGPLAGFLQQQAEKLGLLSAGKLHFLGFQQDAPSLMAELDLLVNPSIREPFGNALVEAGYARLPVVAVGVDGAAEVVVAGETGILLPPVVPVDFVAVPGASPLPDFVVDGRTRQLIPPRGPDPAALADAIITLLQDPARRQAMGDAAFRRAQSQFSIERFVRQLESVYMGLE